MNGGEWFSSVSGGGDPPFIFKQAILQCLDTYETGLAIIVKRGDTTIMDAFIERSRRIIEQGMNAMKNGKDYERITNDF